MPNEIERVSEARTAVLKAIDNLEIACRSKELISLAEKGLKYDSICAELNDAKKRLSRESLRRLEPKSIDFDELNSEWCCPNCFKAVDAIQDYRREEQRIKPEFCPYCGQALVFDEEMVWEI